MSLPPPPHRHYGVSLQTKLRLVFGTHLRSFVGVRLPRGSRGGKGTFPPSRGLRGWRPLIPGEGASTLATFSLSIWAIAHIEQFGRPPRRGGRPRAKGARRAPVAPILPPRLRLGGARDAQGASPHLGQISLKNIRKIPAISLNLGFQFQMKILQLCEFSVIKHAKKIAKYRFLM